LLIEETEMASRLLSLAKPRPSAERGYRKLFLQSVTQADEGVDFDFLQAANSLKKK
jgi:dihydroxy-acid dehydratase